VTAKEEIREMLRNGDPVKEIRMKTRSMSGLYEALTEFLPELSDKLEATRSMVRQEEAKLQETRAENKRLTSEKRELEKDVVALRTEDEQLTAKVAHLRTENDELQTEVETLRAEGFNPEILSLLKAAHGKNAAEVKALLLTQGKAQELDCEVARLRETSTSLRSDIATLGGKKQRLESRLASATNRLHMVEAQQAAFQEVVEIMKTAINDGYKPEELKALLFWLRKLEIQGDPTQSITHVLKCVAEAKTLLNLKREVCLEEKKLDELLRAEAAARDRVEIVQSEVLSRIETTGRRGEEALARVEVHAEVEVSKVASRSTEAIKTMNDALLETISRAVSELSMVQQEKGRLENLLQPARVLSGILESPDALASVPPSLVIQLLENMARWCEQQFPSDDVGAVYDGIKNEFQLNKWAAPRFRISALVKLAVEAMTKLLLQRQRENPEGGKRRA
jgi:myosin heavy subunit